jgi:hypothetical protein
LEPNSTSEFLNILIELGSPGDGKYKENVFCEALKANGLASPRIGTFCYGKKNDSLILHEAIPFEDIHGQMLADIVQALLSKARSWKDSLSRGEIPSFRSEGGGVSSGISNTIFGMH